MKKLKSLGIVVCMMVCVWAGLSSCLNDDDGYSLDKFWVSIGSVEAPAGSAPYFRLDDGSTLWPAASYVDMDRLRDRQRVMVNYTILGDSATGVKDFDYYVRVNTVDTLLTKAIAEDLGASNDSVYGKDPADVTELWVANGCLTIGFEALFGNQRPHLVNLVYRADAAPYLLEFRQNAFDDPQVAKKRGIVCFDLSRLNLPTDKASTLTIRVFTTEGNKDYTVDYNPVAPDAAKGAMSSNLSELAKIQ